LFSILKDPFHDGLPDAARGGKNGRGHMGSGVVFEEMTARQDVVRQGGSLTHDNVCRDKKGKDLGVFDRLDLVDAAGGRINHIVPVGDQTLDLIRILSGNAREDFLVDVLVGKGKPGPFGRVAVFFEFGGLFIAFFVTLYRHSDGFNPARDEIILLAEIIRISRLPSHFVPVAAPVGFAAASPRDVSYEKVQGGERARRVGPICMLHGTPVKIRHRFS
jgi:hypothetical protein